MPRERDPPYVAAGFRDDAQKLLSTFVAKKSLKFADFAKVWQDFHFSTIFMGRENLRELTEFIEECYRNTLLFMNVSDPYQKVGAVYLLYALYSKQPHLLKSQVPIRLNYKQVFEIYSLENHFLEIKVSNDDALDLTYIVTKLFKMEAFSISCFPIPMGPSVPIPLLKLEPLRNSSFKEMLGALRMLNENNIKNIYELSKICEEQKRQMQFRGSATETQQPNKYEELNEIINKLEYHYNSGVFPNEIRTLYPCQGPELQCGGSLPQESCSKAVMRESSDAKLQKEFRSLGQRRAMLKAQQFEAPIEVQSSSKRVGSCGESLDSSPETSPVVRGRGRPRKKPGRRAKKTKVEVAETTCLAAAGENDNVSSETEVGGAEREAESVGNQEMLNTVPYFPYRRPSKYPRPIRTHYFDDTEDKDDDCC